MSQGIDKLSPRERDVMALVARGLTTLGMALALEPPCSEETAKEYLKRIYKKLEVHSRAEAVAKWLEADGF